MGFNVSLPTRQYKKWGVLDPYAFSINKGPPNEEIKMGAHSTVSITRKQAESMAKEKLENLHRMTDKDLEDLIDVLWDSQLLNCIIVPEGMED